MNIKTLRMYLFASMSLMFAVPLVAADLVVEQNPFDYLNDELVASQDQRLFDVNIDQMGPSIFMICDDLFWTVKDVQNVLLKLELHEDQKQSQKSIAEIKKFMSEGEEKHAGASLLKNKLKILFNVFGAPGHKTADYPDWLVYSSGLPPFAADADPVKVVTQFVDPWVVAPVSKKIVVNRMVEKKALDEAIFYKKKFEKIPFSFLYKPYQSKVPSLSLLLGGVFWLWVAKKGLGAAVGATRFLAHRSASLKKIELTETQLEFADSAELLVGPAVALVSADGRYWTFEQIIDFIKCIKTGKLDTKKDSEEKGICEQMYHGFFGEDRDQVVDPEVMRERCIGVMKLLVPSVECNPNSFMSYARAHFSEDFDLNMRRNALIWIRRWAAFIVTDKVPDDLLGSDFIKANIPKAGYKLIVERLDAFLRGARYVPKKLKDLLLKLKKGEAADIRGLGLRNDLAGVAKKINACPESFWDTLPVWKLFFDSKKCFAPFVFDELKIRQAEDCLLDSDLCMALRAVRGAGLYPYPYIHFIPKQPLVEDAEAPAESIRPAARRRISVESSHASWPQMRDGVQDDKDRFVVPVFMWHATGASWYPQRDFDFTPEDLGHRYYRGYHQAGALAASVIRIKPKGRNLIFVGKSLPVSSYDAVDFKTKNLTTIEGDVKILHLGNVPAGLLGAIAEKHERSHFTATYAENLDDRASYPWLSLRDIAQATGCEIEFCNFRSSSSLHLKQDASYYPDEMFRDEDFFKDKTTSEAEANCGYGEYLITCFKCSYGYDLCHQNPVHECEGGTYQLCKTCNKLCMTGCSFLRAEYCLTHFGQCPIGSLGCDRRKYCETHSGYCHRQKTGCEIKDVQGCVTHCRPVTGTLGTAPCRRVMYLRCKSAEDAQTVRKYLKKIGYMHR